MLRSIRPSQLCAASVLKVVFDTVILVRALINPHSFCGRLLFAYSARYRLFVSEPIVREMVEVLQRPELTRKFRNLGDVNMRRVVEIIGQAEVVEISDIPSISRDPKDDMFLATAVAAGADYLVTEDQDLLSLNEYQGTRVVGAHELLTLLEDQPER